MELDSGVLEIGKGSKIPPWVVLLAAPRLNDIFDDDMLMDDDEYDEDGDGEGDDDEGGM